MRVPILHLVFLLEEVLADHVLQFIVRPAAVRVSALAEPGLSLEGAVLKLRCDFASKLRLINSLEEYLFNFTFGREDYF